MPDPSKLKVGDRIRFVTLPDEWSQPGYRLPRESMAFMKHMLKRSYSLRIVQIDEYGVPWISARIRDRGRVKRHTWGILENTGWRKVERRVKQ